MVFLLVFTTCLVNAQGVMAEQTSLSEDYNCNEVSEALVLYYGTTGTLAAPTDVSYVTSAFVKKSGGDSVLTLDKQGNYTVTGVGSAEVTGTFYDAAGQIVTIKTYSITTKVNMEGVKLTPTSQTKYIAKYSSVPEYEFTLKAGSDPLPTSAADYTLSCTSSKASIGVLAYMGSGGKIVLRPNASGTTRVTLTINGQDFKVTIKTVELSMNKESVLLAPNKTSQLKVKGTKASVKWSSTNPKIVKVSSGGKITALKKGNAVIKAKVGNNTIGCVVSVASQAKCKAVKQAIHICTTSQYSQPKRMLQGYYDCSSLVWRAYKSAGIYLGSSSYAPVAADLGRWCVLKKKTVSGGLSYKNVQNMKLNAGDLLFKDGEKNGRYRGIYHVEMITGYVCYGFDSKGKPILELTWANRDTGYDAYGYKLVGRP